MLPPFHLLLVTFDLFPPETSAIMTSLSLMGILDEAVTDWLEAREGIGEGAGHSSNSLKELSLGTVSAIPMMSGE